MHDDGLNSPALGRVAATKPRARAAYETLSVASVGLEMGLAVVIGWALGWYLDEQLGTDPYLTIVFLVCGVAAGFKGMIRVARQTKRIAAESNPATDTPGS